MSDLEGIEKCKVLSLDKYDQTISSKVGESLPPKTLLDQVELAPLKPKQMTIDHSDFAEISTMSNYVDTTLVVARVENSMSAILVTAPKGWGKSTVISTLKRFYEIQVNITNGIKITKVEIPPNNIDGIPEDNTVIEDTSNYRLFEGTELALNRPDVMKHLGKYPVILLVYKSGANSSEDALANCRDAIHNAYKEHRYLEISEKLNDGAISRIKKWCNEEDYLKMGWSDVVWSIQLLSEMLCEHWGRKCVVLIDDFDAITISCLNSESIAPCEFHKIQCNLTMILLYALKGNVYLERGFVTGCTYASRLWSSVNNLIKYQFAEKYDTQFYHFISSEEWEGTKSESSCKKLNLFSTW